MKCVKLFLVGIVAITLMSGSAQTQVNSPTSSQMAEGKPIKQLLLDGSPWSVSFFNLTSNNGGGFTQTFVATQDGRVITTTDEVGPYQTLVEFPNQGQAVWKSPHGRVITISATPGGVVGISDGDDVKLDYSGRQ